MHAGIAALSRAQRQRIAQAAKDPGTACLDCGSEFAVGAAELCAGCRPDRGVVVKQSLQEVLPILVRKRRYSLRQAIWPGSAEVNGLRPGLGLARSATNTPMSTGRGLAETTMMSTFIRADWRCYAMRYWCPAVWSPAQSRAGWYGCCSLTMLATVSIDERYRQHPIDQVLVGHVALRAAASGDHTRFWGHLPEAVVCHSP
ncbi:hypothetical protein [Mycobacteroides abscessus]|uniref:hypothetical protein n=1 Tax=Mycobacteroides abscessus TaxID=36809 RepID=UPI0013FD0EAA|nr:hypothetical protein [Mycobacteroides abscessus]